MSKKSFLLSDESVNSYGFVLLNSGADWSLFDKNPVMLYMHAADLLPIGVWENRRLENGAWVADPVFDTADDFAGQVAGKVERNVLRMASISVDFDKRNLRKELRNGQTVGVITKWLAREASIVPIGANRNAVMLHDETGKEVLSLADLNEPIKPIEDMEFKNIAKALNLADTATESDVMQAIGTLSQEAGYKAKYEALLGDVQSKQKKEALALVDAAVVARKIPAAFKQRYLDLADTNFDLLKDTLANLQAPVDLIDYAKQAAASQTIDQADADAAKWDEHHRKGTLERLKASDVDTFKRLYQAKYGKPYQP